MVLQAKEGCFTALFALVCSSWVSINQYSSGRSVIYPAGNILRTRVQQANCMASRTLGRSWLYIVYFWWIYTVGLKKEYACFFWDHLSQQSKDGLPYLIMYSPRRHVYSRTTGYKCSSWIWPVWLAMRNYERTMAAVLNVFGLPTTFDGQGSEWWIRGIYIMVYIKNWAIENAPR
jgi:hypothetical protein